MLLVQSCHKKFNLPSFNARLCCTAGYPGTVGMVPFGNFHFFSVISTCLGLVTTMSAGKRLTKVPTSRAVPQAEG